MWTSFKKTHRQVVAHIDTKTIADHASDLFVYVEGEYDSALYMLSESFDVVTKPDFTYLMDVSTIKADGIDAVSFSELALGTVVHVAGQVIEVERDQFQFRVDYPGVYDIRFTNPYFLETTVTVTAV